MKLAELKTRDEHDYIISKISNGTWIGGKKVDGEWIWPEINKTIDYSLIPREENETYEESCMQVYGHVFKPADCNGKLNQCICEKSEDKIIEFDLTDFDNYNNFSLMSFNTTTYEMDNYNGEPNTFASYAVIGFTCILGFIFLVQFIRFCSLLF
jgi:hypothetical protein